MCSGTAGGEHGIDNDGDLRGGVLGEPIIIGDGLRGILVAADADVADFNFGDQFEEWFGHPKSCAEDGDKHDAGSKLPGFHGFERCLNLDFSERQIASGFCGEESGEDIGMVPKERGWSRLGAESGEVVLCEGVSELVDVAGS
jgi:hypothetical protein